MIVLILNEWLESTSQFYLILVVSVNEERDKHQQHKINDSLSNVTSVCGLVFVPHNLVPTN